MLIQPVVDAALDLEFSNLSILLLRSALVFPSAASSLFAARLSPVLSPEEAYWTGICRASAYIWCGRFAVCRFHSADFEDQRAANAGVRADAAECTCVDNSFPVVLLCISLSHNRSPLLTAACCDRVATMDSYSNHRCQTPNPGVSSTSPMTMRTWFDMQPDARSSAASCGILQVKSLPYDEVQLLRKILPSYTDYVWAHRGTLLPQFYGVHAIRCNTHGDYQLSMLCCCSYGPYGDLVRTRRNQHLASQSVSQPASQPTSQLVSQPDSQSVSPLTQPHALQFGQGQDIMLQLLLRAYLTSTNICNSLWQFGVVCVKLTGREETYRVTVWLNFWRGRFTLL